jgi:hypothetical protein
VARTSSSQSTPRGFSALRLILAVSIAAIIGLNLYHTGLRAFAPAEKSWLFSTMPEEEKIKRLGNLSPEQRVEEIQQLEKSVPADVLNEDTLFYLAVLHGMQNNAEKASQFAKVASKRNLQSTRLQLIGINNDMRNKDYASAVRALDGLMRANFTKRVALFEFANTILFSDEALPAFATMLGQKPLWRESYLTSLAQQKPVRHRLFKLFAEMRKQGNPPVAAEVSALIVELTRENNLDGAYFLWLDSLAPEQMLKARMLYDGEFDEPLNNLIFGWNELKQKNVDVRRTKGSTAEGMVLSVSLLNAEDFRNVYQFMRLRPGAYALTGMAKASGLKTEGQMTWIMSCADTGQSLGEAGAMSRDQPWTAFESSFIVPPEGCRYQVLRLEARGNAKVERRATGQLMYDKLKIEFAAAQAVSQP